MSAHLRPGAGLAALLSLLALTAAAPPAHAQAASHVWSTYLGGMGTDRVAAIVQQPSNNDVVVAGFTNSKDFPPRTGTGNDVARDAYLAIFTSGGFLRGSPFIFGGSGEDIITAVALGSQGQIYAVGMTQTPAMPGFTTRYNLHGGLEDAFLARFTQDGVPDWIMYLGSAGSDSASGVTVSGTDIYVTGSTTSCTFLGNTGSCLGGWEGFVVKVSNATSVPGIQWQTLITGNGDDFLTRSRVEGSNLLVTGSTTSATLAHSPVMNSFQGGPFDALVTKLSTATGAFGWARYLGNTREDRGVEALAAGVDETVVVGTTETQLEGKNVFATWLNSSGAVLRTRTFGGSEDEVVSSATVDGTGTLYIGGRTLSSNFPLAREFDGTAGPGLPPQEGFVLTVPFRGGPGWASYVGGDGTDDVLAMSILGNRLILGGDTTSSADLVVAGGYNSTRSSPPDGFLFVTDTDITPPLVGRVNDRPQIDNTDADIDTQTALGTLSANWSGFTDPESGIGQYEYAFGTTPGAQDVVPFTATSLSGQTSVTKPGLNLTVGVTYYATVRAINGAGNIGTASSNGVLVVPVVTDGGTGTPDGGSGNPDGGSGNPDGGSGNTDGGSEEEPEDGSVPLMGWSCSAADAGLPVVLGLLALVLLARRRGSQAR